MSTYTDLKNRVKETITVGFRPEDRVTTQKVRFYNKENQYWGTFTGNMAGKIDIQGGTLSSVEISDATLVNPVLKTHEGKVIELGTIGEQIQEISDYVYEDVPGMVEEAVQTARDLSAALSSVPSDAAERLSGLQQDVGALQTGVADLGDRLSSDVDDIYDDMGGLEIKLDNAVSGEAEARQRAIEAEAAARQAADEAEAAAREAGDLEVAGSVVRAADAVTREFRKADQGLEQSIDAVAQDVGRVAGSVADETDARIESERAMTAQFAAMTDAGRHYDIISLSDGMQMPLKAQDFAVNKLIGYDIPDAFVVDAAANLVVGHVEDYDSGTGNCRFVAYHDAAEPYSSILGDASYEFNSSTSAVECADAAHQLVYVKSAAGELTLNKFDILASKQNIRFVKRGTETVGYVYNAGTEQEISAGTLQFIPQAFEGTSLSAFADPASVPFSSGEPITHYPESEIWVEPGPALRYQTGVSYWPMAVLSGEMSAYGGRVYEKDYVKPEGGRVQSFAVTLSTEGGEETAAVLERDGGFEAVVKDYGHGKVDVVRYADQTVKYMRKADRISCEVYITEGIHGRRYSFPLESLDYNRGLLESEKASISFAALSNAVQKEMLPLIERPYELRRDVEVSALTCEYPYGDSYVSAKIAYDGTIDIFFKSGRYQMPFDGDDDGVDFQTSGVYDASESTVYASAAFDAENPVFDSTDRRYAEEGKFAVSEPGGGGTSYVGLEWHLSCERTRDGLQYTTHDLVIEIPDRPEGSTYSREMMFVLRPSGQDGEKVNVVFVTPSGRTVQTYEGGRLGFQVECNKYTTFRLQEITYGKFALLDWDQTSQESRIKALEEGLAAVRQDAEGIRQNLDNVIDEQDQLREDVDAISVGYLPLSGVADTVKQSGVLSSYAEVSDLTAYAGLSDLEAYAKTDDLSSYAELSDLEAYAKTDDLSAYATAEYVDTAAQNAQDQANGYTDRRLSDYMPLSGGEMSGAMSWGEDGEIGPGAPGVYVRAGEEIYWLANGESPSENDVARMKDVYAVSGDFLPLSGGMMTGAISAQTNVRVIDWGYDGSIEAGAFGVQVNTANEGVYRFKSMDDAVSAGPDDVMRRRDVQSEISDLVEEIVVSSVSGVVSGLVSSAISDLVEPAVEQAVEAQISGRLSSYAELSDLEGYMPLSGGTMTGPIDMEYNDLSIGAFRIGDAQAAGLNIYDSQTDKSYQFGGAESDWSVVRRMDLSAVDVSGYFPLNLTSSLSVEMGAGNDIEFWRGHAPGEEPIFKIDGIMAIAQYLSARSLGATQIGVGANQDLSGILGFNNIYHATPAFGYEFLGNTISNFVDGKIGEISAGARLSVDGEQAREFYFEHVSRDEYIRRAVDGDALSNALYVVSSDDVSMYGERIIDLADGQLATDAATYGQLSALREGLTAYLPISGGGETSGEVTFVSETSTGEPVSATIQAEGIVLETEESESMIRFPYVGARDGDVFATSSYVESVVSGYMPLSGAVLAGGLSVEAADAQVVYGAPGIVVQNFDETSGYVAEIALPSSDGTLALVQDVDDIRLKIRGAIQAVLPGAELSDNLSVQFKDLVRCLLDVRDALSA